MGKAEMGDTNGLMVVGGVVACGRGYIGVMGGAHDTSIFPQPTNGLPPIRYSGSVYIFSSSLCITLTRKNCIYISLLALPGTGK